MHTVMEEEESMERLRTHSRYSTSLMAWRGTGQPLFLPQANLCLWTFCCIHQPEEGVHSQSPAKKTDNSKKLQQNRFEILGCLLEDVKVSEEEQQNGGVLRNSPDTMLSQTPPLKTIRRESKFHSWNFGHNARLQKSGFKNYARCVGGSGVKWDDKESR